jgi:hypothetical protein
MSPASTHQRLVRAISLVAALLFITLGGLSIFPPDLSTVSRAATPDQMGSWGPVLEWGFQSKHAAVLPTGKVLLWSTGDNARLWDPATGQFTSTPALFGDLHCAGQATLADGRVIVVGGVDGPPHVGIKVTALFDPLTNTWTNGAPMKYARWYPTVTTMPDGRVLVTNGDDENGNRVLIPEIYDPVTNTWTELTAASRSQSLYAFQYVLPDGRVYEAGTRTNTAILDVARQTWVTGPTNAFGSSGYAESGATYAPGKILRAGGGDPAFANTAVIDMNAATPQWKQVASMNFPRRRHDVLILADGTMMAVGGTGRADDSTAAVLAGEIWDPATEQWTTVAPMSAPRMYHSTSALLPDGRVLTGGGEGSSRLSAQVYSPPYLFKGPRPTISASPDSVAYGSSFSVTTPNATTIESVALIRPAAVTHGIDMNQRYVPLSFTRGESGSLTVRAPANSNLAPVGHYMLVIKDTNGIPSVASWVRVNSSENLAPGVITGRVVDSATGAGITAATVGYSGGSTTTDANGNYTLTGVAAGEHQVTASATAFGASTRSHTVTAGMTSTVDFSLSAPGSISGTITDSATGSPLAGATITYSGGTTTSTISGAYAVSGITAGSQLVTASANGYTTMEQTVTVPANGNVVADFVLSPRSMFISGEVIDGDTLNPISGAVVSFSGGSVTTDELGRYQLDGTPVGTHAVTASASGYETLRQDAIVTSGSYTTSDFTLTPTAPIFRRIKDMTFENGSLLGPSGADSKAGTVEVETAAPLKGAYSVTIPGTGTSYLEHKFPDADDVYVSFYVRLNALPASDVRLPLISNSGVSFGSINFKSNGTLVLRDGASKVGLPSAPLSVGTTYRVGLHQKKGTGTDAVVEGFLATGDAAFGPAFAAKTNGTWTSSANRLRIGATTSVALDATLDDIRIDRNAMPAPSGATPAPDNPAPDNPVPTLEGVSPTSTTAGGAAFTLTVTGGDFVNGAVVQWNGAVRSTTYVSTTQLTAAIPASDITASGTASVTVLNPTPGGGTSTARTFTITAPSTSRLRDITFEGGSLTGPNGASSITGGVRLEMARPIKANYSATIPATGKSYLEQVMSPTPDLFVTFAIRLDALPSADLRVVLVSNGGTAVGNLVIKPNGTLVLRNQSKAITGQPMEALRVGTVYRIGIHQRRGTGINAFLEAFVATGDAAFGSAFAATTSGTWTTSADRIRLGATTATALHATVDDIRIDAGAMPEP